MQTLVERGGGWDVHLATVVACLLIISRNGRVGKQMRAFHLMRDLMQVFNGPGCLENTPDGEEMRLPDAQTKPWLALGISRATWYRQGKPDSKGLLEHNRSRQNYWARFRECSTRTIQRWAFIRRYGIDELWRLAYHERLPCGMLHEPPGAARSRCDREQFQI